MIRPQVVGLTSIPIRARAALIRHFPSSGFSWSFLTSLAIFSVTLRGPFLALDFSSRPATPSSIQRWSVL
ncbi:MAG TPA: hypothetical protein VKB35_02775 [Ktedonobacteraceae bacterium]|nr:hypothetical protein [Ktedonobacteraceae bacterium]